MEIPLISPILRLIRNGITDILLKEPVFEYNPEKSKRNTEKHGVDFEEAQELWKVRHVVFPARHVGGEARYIMVGRIRGQIHVVIFSRRGRAIRLISCHRASSRWEREYREAFHEKKED